MRYDHFELIIYETKSSSRIFQKFNEYKSQHFFIVTHLIKTFIIIQFFISQIPTITYLNVSFACTTNLIFTFNTQSELYAVYVMCDTYVILFQNIPKLDAVYVDHSSVMKGAIPVLPVTLAWLCLVFNVIFPGSGNTTLNKSKKHKSIPNICYRNQNRLLIIKS